MKRKGRCPAEKQQDSCGVWLDASALKRRKMMNVVGKSESSILNQYSSTGLSGPHPCTKQTTIATFFPLQKAGERNANPNELLPAVNLKDHGLLRGKRTTPPTSVLQSSALQDRRRQPVKTTSSLCSSPGNSLPAQVQGHDSTLRFAREERARTEGEAFLASGLIQHLEGKGEAVSMSPLKEKNDGRSPASFSQGSQSFKILSSQRINAGKRCRPACETENTDPELEENTPAAASGFCTKYKNSIGERRCENSSLAPTQPLFTQDSEGHQVISHHLGAGRGKPPLQKEPWQGKRITPRCSFRKDSFGNCFSMEGSPSRSLGTSFSLLTDGSEKSCYDLLFTEDSEGNKVIKH